MQDYRLLWLLRFIAHPKRAILVFPKKYRSNLFETLVGISNWKETDVRSLFYTNSESFEKLLKEIDFCDLNDLTIFFTKNNSIYNKILDYLPREESKEIREYLCFPDFKNPRWLIPKNRSLSIWNKSSLISPTKILSRIAVNLMIVLRSTGILHYLLNEKIIILTKKNENFSNFYGAILGKLKTGIIYTGSFGPLQKFTVELLDEYENTIAFWKFGMDGLASLAIQKERKILQYLKGIDFEKIKVPVLLENLDFNEIDNNSIIISNINHGKCLKKLNEFVVCSLVELFQKTHDNKYVKLKKYGENLLTAIKDLDFANHKQLQERKERFIGKLEKILKNIDPGTKYPIAISHGDFTRWNIKVDSRQIYIYDWEEAQFNLPGFDLLNFLFTEYLLVKKIKAELIAKKIYFDITNGILQNYLLDIDSKKNMSCHVIGIFFLFKTIYYNMYHLKLHLSYGFPPKNNLNNFVKVSESILDLLCGDYKIDI